MIKPAISDENPNAPPAQILWGYLAASRKRSHLPMLKRDDRLDGIARKHSEEMVAKGYFGHVSPYSGELANRLKRSGLAPRRFAENVARSGSLLRIHRNLMASPSHRVNAMDPGFTCVGIGVAVDGNELIATQIFADF